MPEAENVSGPEEGTTYNRRDLLRRGMIAGASAAAFGATVASLKPDAAAADPSPSVAVSVGLASQWPWSDSVNAAAPYYLSPGTGQTLLSSAAVVGEILGPPLLVVPLLINVDVGSPAVITPPFTALILATGNGLAADTVQLSVPFTKDDKAQGHVFTKQWLGVFPVVLGPGSLQLQGTVPAAPAPSGATAQIAGSTLTVTGDYSQAPQASTLSTDDQTSLVNTVGLQAFTGTNVQSGFAIQSLFKIVNDATVSANAKLLQVKSNRSAISIGDMFEMQMLMNKLPQLSESSTEILSAVNTAISSMARNIKG